MSLNLVSYFPGITVFSSKNNISKVHKSALKTLEKDGETNLKVHSATSSTKALSSPPELDGIAGLIQCESPNSDLTNFVGNLKIFNQPPKE